MFVSSKKDGVCGSTPIQVVPYLLGYGTVACYFFPHAVLSNKSVGAKDSLHAVFPANHSVILVRVGGDCSVIVVNADFEVADLLAVHLIICGIFCIRQNGLL